MGISAHGIRQRLRRSVASCFTGWSMRNMEAKEEQEEIITFYVAECVIVIVRQLVPALNLHDFLTFLNYLPKRCPVSVSVFVT